MKKIFSFLIISCSITCVAQQNTVVREYKKVFTTYPFSDPDPIPKPDTKIYPYFRFDGSRLLGKNGRDKFNTPRCGNCFFDSNNGLTPAEAFLLFLDMSGSGTF